MIEAGEIPKGLETILNATEIDPNCVDALVALASAFHRMGAEEHSEQVISLADQAYSADPNHPNARHVASVAHFVKGRMALDAKNWQEAARSFKRSFEIEPDHENLSAFRYCAEKAHELGVFVDACEARLKEQPDDHEVRYKLGRSLVIMACDILSDPDKELIKAELLRRAEGHLNVFLATDSVHAKANYFLGVVFLMTFRLDDAAQMIAKLAGIDSEKSKDLEAMLNWKPALPRRQMRLWRYVGGILQ